MSVYVDDMYKISLGQFGRMKMSHLVADSTNELLEFVDKIGAQRKWIQDAGKPTEHFDISKAKRDLAIKTGAVQVPMRKLASLVVYRKDCNTKIEI